MVLDAQEKIKKLWGRITDVVSGNYQIKLSCKYFSIQSE
jgi:hypothetical protein